MIKGNKNDCIGCKACSAVCPKHAIEFANDEQGFCYPIVHNEKCIKCGKCLKVCQINHEKDLKNSEPDMVYGIKNRDSIRKVSSSGGVFPAIAQNILSKGGCIIGAAFSDNFKVEHISAYSIEDVAKLCGSKYVQSDMQNIYYVIVNELQSGRTVLFSGTPCQVVAVKKYLSVRHVDMTNLITIDIICHGVPSPQIWKDHIENIERIYHKSVEGYSFRNKEKGWKGYHIKIVFNDGSVLDDNDVARSFITLFSNDLIIRPSCFFCQYASTQRSGDITIGDFWGLEKIDSSFCDNKGVSMVIPNTNKGKALINEVINNLDYHIYDQSCLTQPNLHDSSSFGENYEYFWDDYCKHGYSFVAKKYGKVGITGKVYDFCNRIKHKLYRLN